MGKEIFTNIPSKVKNLVDDVRIGKIGLPDLQRPFVWKDNKVRDLFDSMLRGYPIGYVMLWESPTGYDEKKPEIRWGLHQRHSLRSPHQRGRWFAMTGRRKWSALLYRNDREFQDLHLKKAFNS